MQNVQSPNGRRAEEFFGCKLGTNTLKEFVARADTAMRTKHRLQHGDINVAKFVEMTHDPELRRYVAESDVVCVDGMGIVWASRLLGLNVPERVPGIDIMSALVAHCAENRFKPYFLGARQDVLVEMMAVYQARFPNLEIAGSRNGYFKPDDEAQLVEDIRLSGADCLFVGITSPIKERFLFRHRDQIGVPVLVGVGGAFDVLSGRIPRAIPWMQNSGLEWLHRLMQEPRRLAPRYFYTNMRFAGLLAKELIKTRVAQTRA